MYIPASQRLALLRAAKARRDAAAAHAGGGACCPKCARDAGRQRRQTNTRRAMRCDVCGHAWREPRG